jgi:hypothetical protein
MSWVLERLVKEGLTTDRIMAFIGQSPVFSEAHVGLVRRGVEAHFKSEFADAIHLLLPQIEQAVRTLFWRIGRPTNKAHRTGRGAMQFQNLNDFLPREVWPVPGEGGEDLRMYLLATLAHPKGMNLRNDVAHGLLPTAAFDRTRSERVLHVLFAIAAIGFRKKEPDPSDTPAKTPRSEDVDRAEPEATEK